MKQLWVMMTLMFVVPAMADIQTDMINDRLDRLDREMTLLQKKVYTFNPTEKPAVTSPTPTNGSLDELYTQLDEQNRAIADLTQKIEELVHAQSTLREDLNRLNADTQFRFQEQKTSPSEVKKDSDKSTKSDKEAYDYAYNLLMKAKYADAEQAFAAFLKDYPNSQLVGNANYWLGETYYVRGQYDVAAGVFSDGLTKYEKSSKAPDNLLKLGLTMAKLNKKTEACGFLNLLPEKFPKAEKTLKQRAEQEAKKLLCP